ncbi:MAG: hypothetical protein ACQEWU_05160 [Bacillota bacterium]
MADNKLNGVAQLNKEAKSMGEVTKKVAIGVSQALNDLGSATINQGRLLQ